MKKLITCFVLLCISFISCKDEGTAPSPEPDGDRYTKITFLLNPLLTRTTEVPDNQLDSLIQDIRIFTFQDNDNNGTRECVDYADYTPTVLDTTIALTLVVEKKNTDFIIITNVGDGEVLNDADILGKTIPEIKLSLPDYPSSTSHQFSMARHHFYDSINVDLTTATDEIQGKVCLERIVSQLTIQADETEVFHPDLNTQVADYIEQIRSAVVSPVIRNMGLDKTPEYVFIPGEHQDVVINNEWKQFIDPLEPSNMRNVESHTILFPEETSILALPIRVIIAAEVNVNSSLYQPDPNEIISENGKPVRFWLVTIPSPYRLKFNKILKLKIRFLGPGSVDPEPIDEGILSITFEECDWDPLFIDIPIGEGDFIN